MSQSSSRKGETIRSIIYKSKRRGKRYNSKNKILDNINKNNNSKNNLWTLYHLNFRGYNSKRISFEAILDTFDNKPNYLNICESNFVSEKKMKIPGYQSYSRNRRDRMSGGIVSSVLLEDSHNCLKVSEGKDANEYILTRHSQFHPPINVLNVYGAQENRTPVEIIKKHWDDLVEEIVKMKLNVRI